jgi:hypothetical protein
MWFRIAECVCACGKYPAVPYTGHCGKCRQRPTAVGPTEYYVPSTAVPVERGSVVQLVLRVRAGVELAA